MKLIIPSSPIIAYIEVTSNCNNNCSGCGTVFADFADKDNKTDNKINLDVWQTILPKLKPSVAHLCVTGGEPTLDQNFSELLSLISNFEFSLSLFTNARWPNKNQLTAELCATSKLSEILVSLHGPDPESHEGFTGVTGSFIEACNTIRHAVDHDLPVCVNCIITTLNSDRINDMVQISRKLGSQSITFSRFVCAENNRLNPSKKQLIAAIGKIRDQIKASDFPIYSSVCIPKCFNNSMLFNGCYAGTTTLTIDPWGDVHPCVMSAQNCGSLIEKSLHEIWHGEVIQKWRNFIPSLCNRCSAYSSCHGGCRVAALKNGRQQDPLIRDPLPIDHHNKSAEIEISKDASPVKCFKMRAEPFGYILVQNSHVIPVSREAKDILDMCNGNSKMHELYDLFGQDGINLVAKLHSQGMIKLI